MLCPESEAIGASAKGLFTGIGELSLYSMPSSGWNEASLII